jgi:diguanylate cyclase (GGDEF)-like protein
LAIRQGQTMHCADTEVDARVDRKVNRAAGLRSLIYVPMRHHGEVVAVLGVTSPDPHAFQDIDILTTELVAGAIAATYRHAADLASKRALLAELEETVTALRATEAKLAHQVRHDPLTGLPNRAYITDRAEELLVRARRHSVPAAALFLDLDHFKMVNDTSGHKVGDELLCLVADQLPAVLRANDMVGRIGGDEFVILLEGASLDAGVDEVAGRILQTLRELRLRPSDGVVVRTTASIGIASGDRASASDLIHDADLALYEAKAGGRDRFETFVPKRAKLSD